MSVDLDLIRDQLERAYLDAEAAAGGLAAGANDSEAIRLHELYRLCEVTIEIRRLTDERTRLLVSQLIDHQTDSAELGRITDSSPATVEVAVMIATKPTLSGDGSVQDAER